ncbi:putative damage-inducible protein DinB [Paenibacillus forsythiae]|uniref:Putative metal-dependent hydrolase J2Z22_001937 n=1 Tax=Paenibacillus forsythiae TaxID=365616 RepID=A0ABU3H6R2_9BACL|nr:putative metal-dependent hydrolase [Paenibacillus forsythiae]MDT3426411.1 putative damage-inducible protein DinB [Paenibacillus forsythiae]
MHSWAYPLGTFIPEEQPTAEHREQWMEDIACIPDLLRSTVRNLTPEQLLTPYRPGGWNVRQVVHHLADNDMNAYIRFKRALTENAPVAGSYREDLWAELGDYQATPVESSLILLDSLHQRFVVLLRSLAPEQFQRTFTSPTHGEMTLNTAMQRYAWHGRHHIAQIESLIDRMGWVKDTSSGNPTIL